MSLKAKLISTISAFVLILTIVIVAVWAASTANVSLGGKINFQATNVYAKVTGTVTGMDSNPILPTLIFSEGKDASEEPDIEKWNNLDLVFNTVGTPIEIEITVENLSDERSLGVSIQNQIASIENIDISITSGGEASTSATLSPSTGSGTSTVTFLVTVSLQNPNVSVTDALYNILIRLTDESQMKQINVYSNYSDHVALTGGGQYAIGDVVTITATPETDPMGHFKYAPLFIALDSEYNNIIDFNQQRPTGDQPPYSYTFTIEENTPTDYYFAIQFISDSAYGQSYTIYLEGYGEVVSLDSFNPTEPANMYFIFKDVGVATYMGVIASEQDTEKTSVTIMEEIVIGDATYPVIMIGEGESAISYPWPNVTEIILPSSIKVIAGNAFCGLNIQNVQFTDNEFLKYDEESKVFLNDENIIVAAFANSTVPEEATGTFYGSYWYFGGTQLVFGPSLTMLGERTFYECDNLTQITFEGAVEYFAENAFGGNSSDSCPKLKTIVLGAGSTANQTLQEAGLRGTWEKDGEVVTSFSGAGTYTRTDI